MSIQPDLLEKYGLDLQLAVRKLASEGGWTDLLNLSARFMNYSSLNLLLLFSQACQRGFTPTLVAGYRGWQKLGRQVRRGEKALYIFVPHLKRASPETTGELPDSRKEILVGYRMAGVFDVSQTVGDDLPAIPEPRLLDFELNSADYLVEILGIDLTRRGYRVEFTLLDGVNGVTDFTSRTVRVRSDVARTQQLKTLIHEAAHVQLHETNSVSRTLAELEAESCAYVVCRVLGIDSSSYSFPYVARWSHGDVEMLEAVAHNVHRCAKEILGVFWGGSDELDGRSRSDMEGVCYLPFGRG